MTARSATATRILEAARTLFNAQGYAATSVTEIAASLGMSQGNLTYHFPTKQALAMAIEDDLIAMMRDRRVRASEGSLADDYIDHILFGMEVTWRYRFVMRDRLIYAGAPIGQRPDSQLANDLADLTQLLRRMEAEGMLFEGTVADLDKLARSLWIVSRFWIDYLKEVEGLSQPDWADQQRGIEQHLALLHPHLRASAQAEFANALKRRVQPSPRGPAAGSP